MDKQTILQLLKNKNIITANNKKKSCWRKFWDNEIELIFNNYKINYRTEKEAWFCLLHNIEPYKCEVCGNLAKFTGTLKTKNIGYNTTCEKCSPNTSKIKLKKYNESIQNRDKSEKIKIFNKRKQTCLEKYGVENYNLFGSEQFKKNLLNKYGDENYNNRNKYKQTCLEKYGVDHNFKLYNSSEKSKQLWLLKGNDILKKRKQTCLEKYGVESSNQNYKIIEKQKESLKRNFGSLEKAYKYKVNKIKKTKLERYNDETFHNKEKMSDTLLKNHLTFEAENNCIRYTKVVELYGQGWKALNIPIIYNNRFKYISNEFISIIEQYSLELHNIKSQSNKENELYEFIKTLTSEKIIRNSKKIIKDDTQKYEIDIYIPKLKLAFEFNGNYWHSNLIKDKYYHQIKTKLCYANNIQLIHIYEFEWDNNKEEIKNRIKQLFENKDCSKYNWITVKDYSLYKLSEPEIIYKVDTKTLKLCIYNEGNFIKKY